MNEQDELLQERLARLEAGEPLTTAGADLPEETAVTLNLAAELKEITLPEPDETAVVHHRAAVLRAAQAQMSSSHEANQPGEGKVAAFAAFVSWLRSHQAVAVGATAFAAMLLVIFGFAYGWFERGTDNSATVLEQNEDRPVQESESTGSSLIDRLFGRDEEVADSPADEAPPVASGEVDTNEGTEVAAVPDDDQAYDLFLPNVVFPLQTGPQTAVLGDLQGVVSMQKPDGNWEQVSSLSSLSAGTRVRTGALSKASLTFFDGSVAKLGPDSEISIDTLNALRPEEGFRTVVMTQWRGDSTHEVAFRHDGGSRYEVQSPSGTGIARGTVFEVSVLPDLTSRYTVLEGRVDVTSINVTVSVMAGQLSTILADEPPAEPVFQVSGEGEVTEMGESWTIGGQTFATDEQTVIVGNPQLGDWVTVQGHLLDDGTKVADQIVLVREVPQDVFTLTAVVTEMGAEQWLLGDLVILLDEETAVDPDIALNDWVRVTGIILEDGSLLARRIHKQDEADSPFEFTGVVQTIGAESWSISGIAVAVDADTEIKDDPAVGDVVKVEGQITPDGVWLAHEIKAVEDDDDDDSAKFEFTGLVETTDPWVVAGISLATDEWTEIDTAVEPGSLVKVEGVILADGTWLAEEIKLLDNQPTDETIIYFTGEVESIDPWLVNGIMLMATDESDIADDIMEGSLVQVAARLAEDGGWEIVWIRPLLPPTSGCFTIHTRITTINGSQITLANWPNITLDDDVQVDGNLVPNSTIAINICLGDDDTIVVINIIVIQVMIDTTPGPGNDGDDGDNADGSSGNRVTICHKDRNTLTISESGLNGHLGHGDTLGPCGQGGDHDDDHDDDD